ncbi:unnamed protein product [Plutella xylostella]|uniref:(diamondback moth) hypothetical protein n=1 Tax=Plutella xylostella TaxID=51655 RepID=A0A8S4D4Z3_PLUXY|nr:unnamed protein product [Plutella xylostella]
MNELDLIKEVEKRPILYDKSVSGFNKTKLRDDAWKDVQEALNVTVCTCTGVLLPVQVFVVEELVVVM